jgi:hypothetical protein
VVSFFNSTFAKTVYVRFREERKEKTKSDATGNSVKTQERFFFTPSVNLRLLYLQNHILYTSSQRVKKERQKSTVKKGKPEEQKKGRVMISSKEMDKADLSRQNWDLTSSFFFSFFFFNFSLLGLHSKPGN